MHKTADVFKHTVTYLFQPTDSFTTATLLRGQVRPLHKTEHTRQKRLEHMMITPCSELIGRGLHKSMAWHHPKHLLIILIHIAVPSLPSSKTMQTQIL